MRLGCLYIFHPDATVGLWWWIWKSGLLPPAIPPLTPGRGGRSPFLPTAPFWGRGHSQPGADVAIRLGPLLGPWQVLSDVAASQDALETWSNVAMMTASSQSQLACNYVQRVPYLRRLRKSTEQNLIVDDWAFSWVYYWTRAEHASISQSWKWGLNLLMQTKGRALLGDHGWRRLQCAWECLVWHQRRGDSFPCYHILAHKKLFICAIIVTPPVVNISWRAH